MSLTKQLIDSTAHAEELERGVVEYGEVDPPYYEDAWPSEEETETDLKHDYECDGMDCPPWAHDHKVLL